MSNNYFQFKQFRIEQGNCAMKVTTDACILGAWTPIRNDVRRVLDIGAGTGLLSLMLAQRMPGITVDAIELDEEAAAQARLNMDASPWQDSMHVVQADATGYTATAKYDLIISNPPFFNNSLLGDDAQKNNARHTLMLSYDELFDAIDRNLSPTGYASILLPYTEYLLWQQLLLKRGWHESMTLMVVHRPGGIVKRVVCVFGRNAVAAVAAEQLVIQDDSTTYSAAFTDLLRPFYLNL